MLLATCVDTPIDYNVFQNLRGRVARCSASWRNRPVWTGPHIKPRLYLAWPAYMYVQPDVQVTTRWCLEQGPREMFSNVNCAMMMTNGACCRRKSSTNTVAAGLIRIRISPRAIVQWWKRELCGVQQWWLKKHLSSRMHVSWRMTTISVFGPQLSRWSKCPLTSSFIGRCVHAIRIEVNLNKLPNLFSVSTMQKDLQNL